MPVAYPDSVYKVAKAISVAEGSNPEWCNPGDLTYAFGYKTAGTVNSEGVLRFTQARDGWDALYHQVGLMLSGQSRVYNLSDTMEVVGVKYAGEGGGADWAKNVAAYLGVPVTTTLAQLAEG